jgi:diguanylate cyclase (GGDEF)-like protein
MRSSLRLRRLLSASLLARFALLSALLVLVLGLALAKYLRQQARESALHQARGAAVLIAQLGVQPQLRPADFRNGLSQARLALLRSTLGTGLLGKNVVSLQIWSRGGQVIYADDPRLVGKRLEASAGLRAALSGQTNSEVSRSSASAFAKQRSAEERVLEVNAPLSFTGENRPSGAFRIELPYEPIARQIGRDTRDVYLLLGAGLGLLYAGLFRMMAATSRKLRRQVAQNEHQALHDCLTGLPNRTLFHDRTGQALLAARRSGEKGALMLMDLDRFKEVNDSLGHPCGDRLLTMVAERLQGVVRESDTVARLGGDEFAILLRGIASSDAALETAQRLLLTFEEPFGLDGLSLKVAASLGIAFFPDDGDEVDALVQRADAAMYRAKAMQSGLELYAAEEDGRTPDQLMLVSELHQALERREFVLHFQPKVDLRTGEMRSVEALVRWQHPERGMLSPAEFIPLAEQTGLMKRLTLYVLDAALRQRRSWADEGIDVAIAVNLGTRNLLDSQFPGDIARLLKKRGVPPQALELEISENAAMVDPQRFLSTCGQLRALGTRLSIDDFGTGYSSLAQIRRLPVDEIKIDRSFVLGMESNESDAIIVRSTIELGRDLGLDVVAEGIETKEASDRLREMGCELAQGYYFSRPVPAAELGPWLARARPSAVAKIVRLAG